jgi:hypothetical protein
MANRKKAEKIAKNPVDTFSAKRDRGRPKFVDPSSVRGLSDNYRIWLANHWDRLGALLLAAQTEQEVASALKSGDSGHEELLRLVPLMLKVIKAPTLPKMRKAQINFLADSIAGRGLVTPRRSRDICAEQRRADARRHMILRFEFWIECSCGYKGRSENRCCKKCGAVLYLPCF